MPLFSPTQPWRAKTRLSSSTAAVSDGKWFVQTCSFTFSSDGLDESPTARIQRGSSETTRCASTGDSLSHPTPC
jgi:hypothetical protein